MMMMMMMMMMMCKEWAATRTFFYPCDKYVSVFLWVQTVHA